MVDHHPFGGRCEGAPPSGPPELGRALLVVDEHGHAGNATELILDLDDPRPIVDLDLIGELDVAVATGVLGGDDDLGHADGVEECDQLGDPECGRGVLSAGHGHRAVEEDLERHVLAGRDAVLHRQLAGVEEGSIAVVLEQVIGLDERLHPDPLGTLVAHGRDTDGVAHTFGIHQEGHSMTARPGADQRIAGHLGPPVVWAPGAEERCPVGGERQQLPRGRLLFGYEPFRQPVGERGA